MKSALLIIFLTLNLINTNGQNEKQFYFELNGTVNTDSGNIKLIFFSEYTSNDLKELVVPIKNNQFTFSGHISEPQGVFIMLDNHFMSSTFILDKGKQTITIDTDSVRKVPRVKNQIMTNDYPRYEKYFRSLKKTWDNFYAKSDSLQTYYNYNIPSTINLNLTREYDSLCIEDNKLLLLYCEKHPDSSFAFWRLIHLMDWGYEPIYDSIYNAFSSELKEGYAGKIYSQKLIKSKQLKIGQGFPLIQCSDLNNEPFELEILNTNTLTLIDFWYSCCGPCKAQFNKLRLLHHKFNSQGFEIIGISVDKKSDKQNLVNTIENEKLVWKQYWDIKGTESKRYSINAFPTNFLIDNKGVIIAKNISLEELENILIKTCN